MELIHYRHDDTIEQIAKKTDVNLRRMSVQMEQRFSNIMSMIDEINERLDNQQGEGEDNG